MMLFWISGLASASDDSSNQTSILRTPIPIEQIIRQTRQQQGDIVVQSARLSNQPSQQPQQTYVINYLNDDQQWMRSVYDALSGKLLDTVHLKHPMVIEKTLSKLQKHYPGMTLLRTWLERSDGDMVRIVELSDVRKKRWAITLDAHTGQILNTLSYDIKLNGKEMTLAQILAKARERHKGMVVLQTRSSVKNNLRVREIVYLDENRMRRKMTVNLVNGEIISDRITSLLPI